MKTKLNNVKLYANKIHNLNNCKLGYDFQFDLKAGRFDIRYALIERHQVSFDYHVFVEIDCHNLTLKEIYEKCSRAFSDASYDFGKFVTKNSDCLLGNIQVLSVKMFTQLLYR